ncbi:putative tryptophan synthase alpha chain [Actinoplanes missouriensis 431]|uniref:Tryptophan synthase alpha chain n=1 Tax=Actinoplanes missouriensis (strain ATCC 14538 / DSM 43046 / CBS 188.64 / JCM 3121 / NBRC 102363 / NCIMB 12654 / NRRL B-3342 / UNCC 431) TaxID=512565 RepID=I0GXU8_ACTM4|nr:tryptophan synthase subunit alpha [Actinoplanes missouriensis]BAL85585.1 putative tryptophan synthase alpha chain [Actinoplanes missouriensis 431]
MKGLVPYLTGGIRPDWTRYLREYERNGATAIEIGLPFSDPILDGPTIQEASDRALRAGASVATILAEVAATKMTIPLIAMTYYNLVVHRGPELFCRELADAGITGLIVPDLPIDEAGALAAAAEKHGVDLTLLAAPTTQPDRLAEIARRSRGFIYAISVMGTTGERDQIAESGIRLAGELRRLTDKPVLLAFGISRPEHAAAAAGVCDGVVVGAALMRRILDGGTPEELGAVLGGFRRALDSVAV